jgi:hypothetical protein
MQVIRSPSDRQYNTIQYCYLYSVPGPIFSMRCWAAWNCDVTSTIDNILPASILRNLTSLQPVKINALRKSRALIMIGCCHIRKMPPAVHVIVRRFIPLVIPMVTHVLCLDAFWLVTCQVVSKIWIKLHWEWLACRNNHRFKGYHFTKIVPNKLTKKRCLLRFLLEIWYCYVNHLSNIILYFFYRDFERDKFTGKWFCKNVAEWCGDLVPEISEERSKTWMLARQIM